MNPTRAYLAAYQAMIALGSLNLAADAWFAVIHGTEPLVVTVARWFAIALLLVGIVGSWLGVRRIRREESR